MFSSGWLQPQQPLLSWVLRLGLASSMLVAGAAYSRDAALPLATITLTELPVEAQAVHRAIRAGGPFAYDKDGSVFGNRERLLPQRQRGYYREYTVPTPRARDRGARRIVCGGLQPPAPDACFYTADHYASFRRIAH